MNNRIRTHLDEVQLIGKLADLKEDHYRNSLILTALIDVLIDKGVLTTQELQNRMDKLDNSFSPHPVPPIS
ncbi:nitrile hydratase subunit alpha [Paenibacillus chitinolyticus]|uniref:nitrile hydratase subunit alpha n=1 Tax=Paenibacillus chitinolyticus TaxID=79263 RepID=UPI001C43AAE5|nr:nitrile hydratase subunit alpha [Paenibacillus chitinolyticus]MBV6715934.1 nitrile hydratase subunit alpha [Paenibacillus chitinolyticus]